MIVIYRNCCAIWSRCAFCKLAAPAEIEEQEYSLNPGRYVGVVIEEDGKTEEEFIEEVVGLNEELTTLNNTASMLATVIAKNIANRLLFHLR